MSRLSELVLAHLEVEDRSVVPLLAVHVTAEEQRGSMQRSRDKIPQADELRVLAMMLAAADDDERSRMLAPLPDVVVDAWLEEEAPALRRVHQVLADVAARATERRPAMTAVEVDAIAVTSASADPCVDLPGTARRRLLLPRCSPGAWPPSPSWSPASP